MKDAILQKSIEKLAAVFSTLDFKPVDVAIGDEYEKMYQLPVEGEEITICVHKGREIHEFFHRQDFFFLNYAYKGDYGAISYKFDNHIIVKENECYIGQPFTGYALYGKSEEEIIIVGVLIKKDTFFRSFLPMLSTNARLFRFFLNPQTNEFSDEFIHLEFCNDTPIRQLLEMMIIEYANNWKNKQNIIKSLVLTLLMNVARHYDDTNKEAESHTISDKMLKYISEHYDNVTLKGLAKEFGYHPNYISNMLRRETGKSFSEILLQQRMERAKTMLQGTNLSVEEIAYMLGYSDHSNFYRKFKDYFGTSPRNFYV